MTVDWAKLAEDAHRWARYEVDCSVVLERVEDSGAAIFRMIDDDGEDCGDVSVRYAGSATLPGQEAPVHLIAVSDGKGSVVCEALGEMVARMLYV